MKNICIIPARGGSKRIPKKNIKEFCGKPILAYSIEAAIKSNCFDEIMVSTDDDEIKQVALNYGAKVPFMRSEYASHDYAMTNVVLLEVLDEYKKSGINFDNMCCLYSTAPFATADRIKEGMGILIKERRDSVYPIVQFSFPPQRCVVIRDGKVFWKYPENEMVRSQDLEPIYHDTGQFYCINISAFREKEKLILENTKGIIVDEMEAQDIDSEEDWKMAEIKYRFLHGDFG